MDHEIRVVHEIVVVVQQPRTSEALLELGRRYAREDGFEPLRPGEELPLGWVTANHATGRSDVPINARVRSKA